MISLRSLVDACGELGCQAGVILRQVHQARLRGGSLGIVNKSDNASFDPQTVADRRAERRIVHGLRSRFGDELRIVGEEESSGSVTTEDGDGEDEEEDASPSRKMITLDWWADGDGDDISADRLAVFIDPLDATREFTEGRVEFCTVLIGICIDGAAVAGVMVEPFVAGNDVMSCWWGAVGRGCFHTSLTLESSTAIAAASTRVHMQPPPAGGILRLVVSRSRSGGAVDQFVTRYVQQQQDHSIAFAGGCGYKILEVLKGQADLYPFPCPGTSSWDSCAGSALLHSAGGALCGIDGRPLIYLSSSSSSSSHKVSGLMAGCDARLVQHACAMWAEAAKSNI